MDCRNKKINIILLVINIMKTMRPGIFIQMTFQTSISVKHIFTFSQYDAHSKPLFMKLHILDLQKLIIHRIALMMYKHSVQLLPVPVSNLFIKNSSIHKYNTRSYNMLHTKIGSSEVTYTNFSYHGVHIWNIMERNIPSSISYNGFKYLSKKCIRENDLHYRLRS